MLSSATNLLNFNVLIKKGDQQHVFFHSIETKYVRNEKKSKNWKFYINTMKNVSTASHKLPHFLSEHVFIVKNKTQKVWSCSVDSCGNRERKTWREVNFTPSLNGVNQIYTEVTPWCCISKRNGLTSVHSPQLRPFAL